MEQINAPSIVSLFDANKQQRQTFIDQVIQSVVDGHNDVRSIHYSLKVMEEITKKIMASPIYKSALMDEMERFEKSFEFKSSRFDRRETGVKYDWKSTCDPVVIDLMNRLESLESELKERTDFLKTVPKSGLMVTDPETGETVQIFPPNKTSTETVAVTLK